jgi:DNA-binding NtrC family response regulator
MNSLDNGQVRPTAALINPPHDSPTSQRHIRALVVSPQLEVRKVLVRVLEALSTDVISCSTQLQAEEVLSLQSVEVVFCDENLPDGSYADLIHPNHWDHKIPRVIVATRTGEWEFYFEALRKGAFDVVRCPWYATDVEMSVIRALREEDQATSFRAAV